MNWRYIYSRILAGVFIYMIVIFIFSALFDTTMERTLTGQIEEQIQGELAGMKGMTSESILSFAENRRAQLYHIYHLDVPKRERIFYSAFNTLIFNYGKSTNIKSFSQSDDVRAIVFEALPKSVLLFTTNAIICIIIGLTLGLIKARKAGGIFDKITSIMTMILILDHHLSKINNHIHPYMQCL